MLDEEVIKVGMGDLAVARDPQRLGSFGVGSCICVALYDSQAKVGGIAHAMLPADPGAEIVGRGLEEAVPALAAALVRTGADMKRLSARLVGGATMFSFPGKQSGPAPLGERNLQAARKALQVLGIPVTAEDCGGSSGRSLELDLKDGSLAVWSAFQYIRWL